MDRTWTQRSSVLKGANLKVQGWHRHNRKIYDVKKDIKI